MSWLDEVGVSTDTLQNYWNTAIGVNSGAEYDPGKTSQTVPTNAVQSMEPVTSGVVTPGWEGFMQNVLGGLVGYAVRKDAAQNGVPAAALQAQPGQQMVQPATAPRAQSLVLPIALGLGVIVAGALVYKLVK